MRFPPKGNSRFSVSNVLDLSEKEEEKLVESFQYERRMTILYKYDSTSHNNLLIKPKR